MLKTALGGEKLRSHTFIVSEPDDREWSFSKSSDFTQRNVPGTR